MKKTTGIFIIVILVVMSIFVAGCSAGTGGKSGNGGNTDKQSIGIIQYVEHVALDKAREGFVDALKDNGYTDGENISIDLQNAQADPSNLSSISDRFISNKVDLVLAIATPAAQSIAGKTTDIPILGTAITDYVSARLVDSDEAPGGNVSGTSDMNPIEEQIDLLVRLAPEAETVGVIYASNEDNSILQASIAKEAVEKLGLKYVEVTVTNTNDVQQATQTLVDQCDAIYIPTDNVLASAMPTVHGVVSKTKTPVICGESNMVESGGLATLGLDYYDLGYQTGKMAVGILKGEAKPADMAIQTTDKREYLINGDVAEELGIAIPDDLKQYIVKGE
ncbi:MAG: ABC transporter substrate-binding protein [Clostridiales bacterium]|nr:ABC transporter substrate-binding protein [Clostridiales bacterium]